MKTYLIGSLHNPDIPVLGNYLREVGLEIFDSWHSAGPEADSYWKQYSEARGQTYSEALADYSAQHVFEFDKHHLDTSGAGVLAMPCGKSGWAEMGYLTGQGKPVFAYFDGIPAYSNWDVMLNFTHSSYYDKESLRYALVVQAKREEAQL